jgi:hypothetical protein
VVTHVADANRGTLPSDTCDLVLCHACLHHFVELERVLDEIGRELSAHPSPHLVNPVLCALLRRL